MPSMCKGVFLLALAASFAVSASAKAQDINARFGYVARQGTFIDSVADRFKDQSARQTNGRFKVQLFPAGQLGPETAMLLQLQRGDLQIAFVSPSVLASSRKGFELDDIPFVATDYSDAYLLDRLARQRVEELSREIGVTILFSMRLPPIGLVRRGGSKELQSLADLKGAKTRVAGQFQDLAVKAWGGSGAQIAFAEVANALQAGAIDSSFINPGALADLKLGAAARFEDLRMLYPKVYAMASRHFFERLPAVEQQAIRRVSVDVEQFARQESKALDARVRADLLKSGVVIAHPAKALIGETLGLGRSMATQWTSSGQVAEMASTLGAYYGSTEICEGDGQCGRSECADHHHCTKK